MSMSMSITSIISNDSFLSSSIISSTKPTVFELFLPHSGPNPTVLAYARPGLASWGNEVAL